MQLGGTLTLTKLIQIYEVRLQGLIVHPSGRDLLCATLAVTWHELTCSWRVGQYIIRFKNARAVRVSEVLVAFETFLIILRWCTVETGTLD